MFQQVQIPHSVVAGRVPTPAEVVVGGIAVNITDRKLFSKDYSGKVTELSPITPDSVKAGLGYAPAQAIEQALPPPANDLASAITLLNAIRTALISCGIGK